MKRKNDYKIRAFELGQQGGTEHETAQQIPSGTKKETPFPKHFGTAGSRPAWRVEAVEDIPKKKRVRHKKAHSPKQPLPKMKKEGPSPLEQLRKKFARKPKPPEVPPLDSGATTIPDILAPASVDLRHRDYIVADGVYHAYLYVAGYGYTTTVGNGWLNPLVDAGEGIHVSFIVQRQPKEKILPKVAKTTMINRSRMRDVGDTRQDFEELDSAISAGLWMKEEMNRNGEEFYFMHTLIEVTADDKDTLEQRVSGIETLCTSLDMVAKRCDYRHEQGFLSSLPLLALDPDIERKSRRNALTTGVAAAFPFSSFEICDQSGIMLGINLHNRSVCMLDIFDSSKYSNAGMILMGMSGAGKTFLLQLIASRLRQQGVQIFIVAPLKGHEFRPLCEAIGGTYIKLAPSSNDCINIFDIRRKNLDTDAEIGRLAVRDDSLLADKIARLHIYYSLLMPDMTPQERNHLDAALVEVYRRKGITYDNGSLFEEDGVTYRPMPTRKDMLEVLSENPDAKNLALVESRFVTGSAKRLGQATNVDLDNQFVVIDTSEIGKDLLAAGTFTATDFCTEKCKESRVKKKALILDELWALIGASSNPQAAEFVLECFKTYRAFGAAVIGATQDLNDFFALESGKFGRAILNNSKTKIILNLEPDEAEYVKDVLKLTRTEIRSITQFERGEALISSNSNKVPVIIKASREEQQMITTDRAELEAMLTEMKAVADLAERSGIPAGEADEENA